MLDSGGGFTKAEDAQGTPTQSHVSPSILVYEDNEKPSTADRVRHISPHLIEALLDPPPRPRRRSVKPQTPNLIL